MPDGSPHAEAFTREIRVATTKAEVSAALSRLEQAADLSHDEKRALVTVAATDMTLRRVGFGVDVAFRAFLFPDKVDVALANAIDEAAVDDDDDAVDDLDDEFAVGKGNGVVAPTTLRPNETVRARVSRDDLRFAEAKLVRWHDARAVSDDDVKRVRAMLSVLFALPDGQYLTLARAQSGEPSALSTGNHVRGDLRDRQGNVVAKIIGNLDTAELRTQTIVVAK